MKFKLLNEAQLGDVNPETGFQYSPEEIAQINAKEKLQATSQQQKNREQEKSDSKQRAASWKSIKDKMDNDQFYAKSNDAVEDVTNLLKQFGIS